MFTHQVNVCLLLGKVQSSKFVTKMSLMQNMVDTLLQQGHRDCHENYLVISWC